MGMRPHNDMTSRRLKRPSLLAVIFLINTMIFSVSIGMLLEMLTHDDNSHPVHHPSPETSISTYQDVDPSCLNTDQVTECAFTDLARDMQDMGKLDPRWGIGPDKPITNVNEAIRLADTLLSGEQLRQEWEIGLTVDKGEIVVLHIRRADGHVVASQWLYP